MNEIDADDILSIAKKAARSYARCWWADRDDLVSEASVAVLQAHKTWDPEVGVPWEQYARIAAVRRLRQYLWAESAPVSGGLHDPRKHLAGKVRDFSMRMHIDETTSYADPDRSAKTVQIHATDALDEHVTFATMPNPGAVIDHADWRLKVRRRIRALARDGRDGDLAIEVLVRGRQPKDLVKETGRDVHGAVHLVRRKMREDKRTFKLWQQNGGRHG